MLVPRSRRRTSPNDLTISSARAVDAFSLVTISLSASLRSFSADSAVVLRRVHLAASQGRDLEDLFEPERRGDVRLFGCRLRFLSSLCRRVVLIQVSRLLPSGIRLIRLFQPAASYPRSHIIEAQPAWLLPTCSPSSSRSRCSRLGSRRCCRYQSQFPSYRRRQPVPLYRRSRSENQP